MANTLQAAAVSLLSRNAKRLLLSDAEKSWIRAICADPTFASYLHAEPVDFGELEDVRRADRRRRDCLMMLAAAIVVDRQLGSPADDHMEDMGMAWIATSLASAIVEYSTAMEEIAFIRGAVGARGNHAGSFTARPAPRAARSTARGAGRPNRGGRVKC